MSEEQASQDPSKNDKGFIEELLGDVFNLDRGLPGTIWGMIKSPGEVIDAYFTDKGKYVTPLRFCIFILAVTTFISVQFIDYEAMMENAMELGAGNSLENTIEQLNQVAPSFNWEEYFQNLNVISVNLIQKFNQILYLVLLAPIFAWFTKLFFKKKKSRFIEHYVLMVYSLSTFSIFSLLLIPAMKLTENAETPLMFLFGVPFILGYLFWPTIKYLNLKGFSEYLQAIIALVLGYIVYSIISAIVMYAGAYVMMFF